MSDFGTMATVHRENGDSTTPADEALIKQIVKELVVPFPDRINDFASFNLRFGGSSRHGGSEGVMVGLTEYWVGDKQGNEGLDDEVLIERDRPLAEQFAERLLEKLGPDFQVEV